MAFHKSNRRQSVFSPRASTYLVGALNGQTAPTTLTVSLSRQFRLFSPVIVGVPGGLPSGVSVSANLLPPTGPAAAGNPTQLQIVLGGTGSITTGDLLVTQC